MKRSILLALSVALLASYASAANPQATAVYTFLCKGNAFFRTGTCPQGGRGAAIILGSDGNFYGTAQVSGEGSSSPNGGTVFSLTPTGTQTVLHTFGAGPGKNYPGGNLPGLLTEGPDGKIYGETVYGGVSGCNGYCGYGVLYRVNKDGSGFQVIHRYCSRPNCADGQYGGALVVGTDNNIYGTTFGGGASENGTIFKVTPSTGAYEVVYNFNVDTSGEDPSGLVVAADGTFYGLAAGSHGEMLFHYTEATGTLTSVPMNFPLVNGLPSSGGLLTIGPGGNLFGTYAVYGLSGAGVFEIEPDGSNLQLFPFYTNQDGAGAPQLMLFASDGNLWVDDYNGADGYGDLVALSPTDGSLVQRLSLFSPAAAVGAYPTDVIQLPDGTFMGTTNQNGVTPKGFFADGTVFSLNAGLPRR